jgi:NAD(P)-dependent dehydrogenase (short-subunit alcohol dehydrogenase family)
MKDLEGRVAVITGGGSGIGEGLAHACHDAGMRITVSDIEGDQAERVADSIRELGGEAFAMQTDVSDLTSVEQLAEQAYTTFGSVNLLCSNAGVMMVAPLLETQIKDWEWTIGVNVFGAVHCVQAFAPKMREQQEGSHIVLTASVAGTRPIFDTPIGTYVASKFAVVGYAEMLRHELATDGIGVSALCPGGVDTQIFTATRNRPDALGGAAPPPPEAEARMAEREEQSAAQTLMPPLEVARRTLEGVRANRLYIFTHADTRMAVEERHHQLMADYDAVS